MTTTSRKPKHWANISESGATIGMRFLLSCYKIGGRRLFQVCLFPVITYYFIFRLQARSASMHYIRRLQRLGVVSENQLWQKSFIHFWNFANALIDKFAVWMKHITIEDVVIEGDTVVEKLISEKQGAVIIISQ